MEACIDLQWGKLNGKDLDLTITQSSPRPVGIRLTRVIVLIYNASLRNSDNAISSLTMVSPSMRTSS